MVKKACQLECCSDCTSNRIHETTPTISYLGILLTSGYLHVKV